MNYNENENHCCECKMNFNKFYENIVVNVKQVTIKIKKIIIHVT